MNIKPANWRRPLGLWEGSESASTYSWDGRGCRIMDDIFVIIYGRAQHCSGSFLCHLSAPRSSHTMRSAATPWVYTCRGLIALNSYSDRQRWWASGLFRRCFAICSHGLWHTWFEVLWSIHLEETRKSGRFHPCPANARIAFRQLQKPNAAALLPQLHDLSNNNHQPMDANEDRYNMIGPILYH